MFLEEGGKSEDLEERVPGLAMQQGEEPQAVTTSSENSAQPVNHGASQDGQVAITTAMASTSQVAETVASSQEAVAPELPDLDRHGYLFGLKLANSWSPFLHDSIYQELGLQWGQVRLESSDIDLFLKLVQHPNFYGSYLYSQQ